MVELIGVLLLFGVMARTLVVVCTRWWKATDDRLIFANVVAGLFLGTWYGLYAEPDLHIVWPIFWRAALCQIPCFAVDMWRYRRGLAAEPEMPGKPVRHLDAD
jgi:hypothetical protein